MGRTRLTIIQKREIIEISQKPSFNSKARQQLAENYGIETLDLVKNSI